VSAASLNPSPFASGAWQTRSAGYSPFPVNPSTKGDIPGGFTGYTGRAATDEELSRWVRTHANHNLGARLPRCVVGIDVDAYGAKVGSATLAALVADLGELPFTFRVTARLGPDYDGESGIRLFRIPTEFEILAGNRVWIGGWEDIELVRHGHRYVMAPPSIHPNTGTQYKVLDEATGEVSDSLPAVQDLPFLPAAWCLALLKANLREPGEHSTTSGHWTGGEPCAAVQAALAKSLDDLSGGRHSGALRSLARLTRLGEQGHAGVAGAVATLRVAFEDASTTPGIGQRSRAESSAEWMRMVAGVDDLIESEGFTARQDQGCCPGASPGLHAGVTGAGAHTFLLPEAMTLSDAEKVFTRWFGPEYDLAALHAVAAAVAVERLDGDAPWLLLVSGSGNAKTETVSAAEGAGALITSTISSEGALISATATK
jgi:hypothetical protein